MSLNTRESALREWIFAQRSTILDQLTTLVNQNSYTANIEGVAKAFSMFNQLVDRHGFERETIAGKHMLVKAGSGGPRLLLISHMDTVHPPESGFTTLKREGDEILHGPGVGDMKGGLLAAFYAMAAFKATAGSLPCEVHLVISAEEETGSETMMKWFAEQSPNYAYALGFEPGHVDNLVSYSSSSGVVIKRKGTGRGMFTLRGKAAHSGGAYSAGLSAIEAFAHKTIAIHRLANTEKGMTTNVGLVSGGTAANTIAETCSGEVDWRFDTVKDGEKLRDLIHEVLATPSVRNAATGDHDHLTHWQGEVLYPPMVSTEQAQKLAGVYVDAAQSQGQQIKLLARGGSSDACFTSAHGVASICGLGIPCSGIHTEDERAHLTGLLDRAAIAAVTLERLAAV